MFAQICMTSARSASSAASTGSLPTAISMCSSRWPSAWRSRPLPRTSGLLGSAGGPAVLDRARQRHRLLARRAISSGVEQPALTIVVLAVLCDRAVASSSLRLPSAYERVALIAARTAMLMINLAFLVGSLFGDQLTRHGPARYFTIAWALLLIGVGLWGVMPTGAGWSTRRRCSAPSTSIRSGSSISARTPLSILGGGMLLIGLRLRAALVQRPKLQAKAAARPRLEKPRTAHHLRAIHARPIACPAAAAAGFVRAVRLLHFKTQAIR